MSAIHRVIWRGQEDSVFTEETTGETLYGTPVIASSSHALTVGLQVYHNYAFGYWHSIVNNPIEAWRTAQLLPLIMWMRPQHFPYASTITMVVEAVRGDRNQPMLERLVRDLRTPDLTVEEFEAEVDRINRLWPTSFDLCEMWDKLGFSKREAFADALQDGFGTGNLPLTEGLQSRLETHRTEVEQARRDAQAFGGGEWIPMSQGPSIVATKQPRFSVIRRKFVGRIRRSR